MIVKYENEEKVFLKGGGKINPTCGCKTESPFPQPVLQNYPQNAEEKHPEMVTIIVASFV